MSDPGDEWTMICPPGWMDEALELAATLPENVREVAESVLALGKFLLINDTQVARVLSEPIRFEFSYEPLPRWGMQPLVTPPPLSPVLLSGT